MYGYVMSIAISELVGISFDLLSAGSLSIYQNIGILIFALAVGILFGVLSNANF